MDPHLVDHQDPYPTYGRLRREGRAVRDPPRDAWVVSRYDDVSAVLADGERFSSRRSGPERTLLGGDGSSHGRVRRVVQPAFSMDRVSELRAPLRTLASDLASRLATRGECELVSEFAALVPASVVTWMFGLELSRRNDVIRWSHALMRQRSWRRQGRGLLASLLGGRFRSTVRTESHAFDECITALSGQLNRADRAPTGGWVVDLLGASGELSRDEKLDAALLLLIAATETTRSVIASFSFLLARDPDLQARVRAEPELRATFVEEVLRYESPVKRRPRVTTQPVRLGDVDLPAGAQLDVLIGSANRDPEKFPDADLLLPDRSPNPHLAFAPGPHHCIGAQLARLEAMAALDALLEHAPFRLARPDEPADWADTGVLRDLRSLRLKFG